MVQRGWKKLRLLVFSFEFNSRYQWVESTWYFFQDTTEIPMMRIKLLFSSEIVNINQANRQKIMYTLQYRGISRDIQRNFTWFDSRRSIHTLSKLLMHLVLNFMSIQNTWVRGKFILTQFRRMFSNLFFTGLYHQKSSTNPILIFSPLSILTQGKISLLYFNTFF